MAQELIDFIRHARGQGMDHATIRVLLTSAGWKERDLAQAMAAEGLGLPIPQPYATASARDVFLYLLQATTLYTTVVSLIILYFNYLNLLLPDSALQNSPYAETSVRTAIRWSLATVIVAGPFLMLLTRIVGNQVRRHPDKLRVPARRWLTYLTLFAAAVTIMFDVVTLLFYILEGELTARVVLKAAVLAVIVTGASYYYLATMRTSLEGTR